ncbi:ABC transporter ATP-binding protein [Neobacillus sp. D3-1R]|uniref:ABC transporter ATP-binding protein n=1 Tax=Neobacillus sp. D3-1R TaxID=3445778 RepID=UPI003FA139DC
METVLQISNLKKRIGKKTIIHDLTLDVYKGEVFGFLGPNGAGKTTTIRMIVGLMSITEGQVLINGKSVSKDFESAVRHVGAIVENPELYKFLTGYQNLVHYSRMMKGISQERIQEVVKLVGLENRIHDKVKTYSLGMRQRLGLAQALLHRPSLLILDEPTNGLDPAGIREIRDYLRKLAKEEGLAVFVSSHLLSEMELMCDRIGILQNGKLIDVQSVKGFTHDKEMRKVVFTVDSASMVQDLLSAGEVLSGVQIELTLEKEDIPAVVAKLVEKDIKIFGIETKEKSLEDKFLEITGGEQIV